MALLSRKRLLSAAIVIAIAAVIAFVYSRLPPKAGELLTAKVEKGDVRRTVAATGSLKAVVTVQVGSQVTGVIQSLGADYNSVVSEGQVIARIDPATFQAQLERAQADLASATAQLQGAKAALTNQRANRGVIKANLDGAIATRDQAERILARHRGLAEQGVLSTNELEATEANALEARARVAALEAQVKQSDAQLLSAASQLDQAKSQIDQSTAAVTIAKVNLDHTVIASPIDGVVISRSVDVGQTVAASLSAPTLFVLANDLRKMNVIASIDEADIGSISQDTIVSFTVDAFPGETFTGTIHQVRLEPQTVQNVVTYNVIVNVDNPDLKLRPGMTANVTLSVAEAKDVLRLPNAALRFWPEDVPRTKLDEILRGAVKPATGEDTNLAEAKPRGVSPGQAQASDGLSPQGMALVAKLRDPNLPREARRELFAEMRELPEAERTKIREMAGMGGDRGGGQGERQREGALGGRGSTESGELRFPAPPPAVARPRVIWLQIGKKIEPRRVMVSINDGSMSAVVAGDLAAGDTVIVGQAVAGANPSAPARSPFAPAVGGGGGRGGAGGGGGRR